MLCSSPEDALKNAFIETDRAFRRELETQRRWRKGGGLDWHPGCTATTALLVHDMLFVANAGDCRTIVCRNGKAVPLTTVWYLQTFSMLLPSNLSSRSIDRLSTLNTRVIHLVWNFFILITKTETSNDNDIALNSTPSTSLSHQAKVSCAIFHGSAKYKEVLRKKGVPY